MKRMIYVLHVRFAPIEISVVQWGATIIIDAPSVAVTMLTAAIEMSDFLE